jgi:hypothetical protein
MLNSKIEATLRLHSTTSLANIKLRIVLQEGRDNFLYDIVVASATETGEDIMKKVRKRYYGDKFESLSRKAGNVKQFLRFSKVAVGVVKLSPVSPHSLTVQLIKSQLVQMSSSNLESQRFPCKVFIESSEYSQLLTRAFHRPDILRSADIFVSYNACYAFGAHTSKRCSSKKALLIKNQFDKAVASIWFGLALVISVAIGIGMGSVFHDVNFGISIGSGMLALLTAVQGLVMWLYA